MVPQIDGRAAIQIVQLRHLRLVHTRSDADEHELQRMAPAGGDLLGQPTCTPYVVEIVQFAVGDEDIKTPGGVAEALDEVATAGSNCVPVPKSCGGPKTCRSASSAVRSPTTSISPPLSPTAQ